MKIIYKYNIEYTLMGNIQTIIEKMDDNQKLEFLIKEGFLNDEIIQLYRQKLVTIDDIHEYLFDNTKN